MNAWTRLMGQVADRHGVVTRTELTSAELSADQIDHLHATGRLIGNGDGVYRIAGAPASFESRVMGAILATNGEAWASHETAARLWGISAVAAVQNIELTRPYGLSANRRGVTVHRSTNVPPWHVTSIQRIPITTPARTLFDLARTTAHAVLDRAVEGALRERLCTIGALHRVLAELGGRGRPGTRRMRSILESRDVDYVPTSSELEGLGRAVLESVPGIAWEVPMSDEQGYIRRVDGLVRPARVVIEFDGSRFHGQPSDVARDSAADARLLAAGFVVLRFGWIDLTRRPESVRATVDRLVLAG